VEENFNLFEYGLDVKLSREQGMEISLESDVVDFADDFICKHGLAGKKIIGIHAGSDVLKNMINRRWAPERFGELLRMIHEKKDYKFLIFGGKNEVEMNDKICSYLPDHTKVVKNTGFLQSAAIISKCNYFISNDSGLMHTAAALKVPVLLLLGPTNATYIKPYKMIHEIASKNYDCMPCFEYSGTPLICDQNEKYRCMKDLTVAEVYQKFEFLEQKVAK